jgi:hypothetical protein
MESTSAFCSGWGKRIDGILHFMLASDVVSLLTTSSVTNGCPGQKLCTDAQFYMNTEGT